MKHQNILSTLNNSQNVNYCLYGNIDELQFEQYVSNSENDKIIIIYKINNTKKNALMLSGETNTYFKYTNNNLVEINEEQFEEEIGDYAGIVTAPEMIKSIKEYVQKENDSLVVEETSDTSYQIKNDDQTMKLFTNPRNSMRALVIESSNENCLLMFEELTDSEFEKSTQDFESYTNNNISTVD